MPWFKKKPVSIRAIRWTGDNFPALCDLASDPVGAGHRRLKQVPLNRGGIAVTTIDSTAYLSIGDWLIRGVQGELYPCKPDIFEATYEFDRDDDRDDRVALTDTFSVSVDSDGRAREQQTITAADVGNVSDILKEEPK